MEIVIRLEASNTDSFNKCIYLYSNLTNFEFRYKGYR